ncbi:hypothetical protein TRIUR3_27036 [Triticum urartu]|uniref:Derlin n=1 Tax=Triticum urartu TaxID=4572 RepID=M7ZZH0_TRIUA|nr:hypothetical protein TRIUR3_27036 [Triticum urartu]
MLAKLQYNQALAAKSQQWLKVSVLEVFRIQIWYYNSLPPISKAYGTLCFFTTVLVQLQILDPGLLYLSYPYVFKSFQIWRLFTSFFFLGKFSINFGIRLLMIARYGVQLEKGSFEKRAADFLWMMIFGAISLLVLSAIPYLETYLLGIPMVSMLLYVWSREYPNSQISMYGLVQLRSFYLPWAMLGLDVIFGSPILPGLLGIMVGHLYYFFTVLYPLASGKNYLKTPMWVYPYESALRKDVRMHFWPETSGLPGAHYYCKWNCYRLLGLNLAGYYWRFIRNYGIICKPLYQALKKDNFKWTGAMAL